MSPLHDGPLWYKDVIIYELHIRSFYDSDADGIGDFRGAIEKLDYLANLGVSALWLLPFYPSPLKDDGYDISDYNDIHSVYGSLSDFKTFVHEAHRRGMRVITELVINHTSDQHPWFQRARRSPPGKRPRELYVWSDTPDKYKEARIIFKDYEHSNWTWDHLAKAYYWHRFYSHQPDLNYDNPAVKKAILRVVDFWLKMGVDGLRVDAVPYLYERDGTSCENLPETHDFLKELRSHIDKKFNNRMLLAEANQWPEDAAPYFGNGAEFHMAFHFPIMPRLFMAIGMEDRFPLIDIIRQTPDIPENCQWTVFLRNHDELTLEMVTDEERDYMYRVYASDPAARINLGIRRRLSPLLNNDRRKIELMNALLLSLPGTPVIYYGDEIGMGDNFYLGDRNGVRTPMQWSPDRNAGFSRANPQRLYLPPITDPGYHYEAVNVETQQANADSLLWWMKRIIALRKNYRAFGRGNLEFLLPRNRKVLAFLRRYEDENILVVANLSHMAQQTQLDLSGFTGQRLIDIFGPVEFTPVSEGNYNFTLNPYTFYWFSLQSKVETVLSSRAVTSEEVGEIPTIACTDDSLFDKDNWPELEKVIQSYVGGRRWFRGKARDISSCRIIDVIPIVSAQSRTHVLLVQFNYLDGEPETYVVPLSLTLADNMRSIRSEQPQAIIARIRLPDKDNEYLLWDAMLDKDFLDLLLASINRKRRFKGIFGELASSTTRILRTTLFSEDTSFEAKPMKVEQSNTSIVYGNRLVLKLFRQLGSGINPELEIGRFLTEKTSFTHFSPIAGAVEYRRIKKNPVSV
ncbi:maltose alpha-D-glucosyltransferase, partial [Chloroflexota bacterium]